MSITQEPPFESLPGVVLAVSAGGQGDGLGGDGSGFEQGQDPREVLRPADTQGRHGKIIGAYDAQGNTLHAGESISFNSPAISFTPTVYRKAERL